MRDLAGWSRGSLSVPIAAAVLLAAGSLAAAQSAAAPLVAGPSSWIPIASSGPPVPVRRAFVPPNWDSYVKDAGRLGVYTADLGTRFYWAGPPLLTSAGTMIGAVEESVPPGDYSEVAIAAFGTNGTALWQYGLPLGVGAIGPFAVGADDLAYMLGNPTRTLVLLTAQGDVVSRTPLTPVVPQGYGVDSITPIPQGYLLALDSGRYPQVGTWEVVAVSPSGHALWATEPAPGNEGGVSVDGTTIFVSGSAPYQSTGESGSVTTAFSLATGARLWSKGPLAPQVGIASELATASGLVVAVVTGVTPSQSTVEEWSGTTGAEMWHTVVPSPSLMGGPDDFVACHRDVCAVYSAATGEPLNTLTLRTFGYSGRASPVAMSSACLLVVGGSHGGSRQACVLGLGTSTYQKCYTEEAAGETYSLGNVAWTYGGPVTLAWRWPGGARS